MRKLPDDEGFDVRPRRFFVVEISPDISNVRIGKADDLPGIAGVSENFLVTGEAGIENNFAAAARDCARGAAVKNPPVFEGESGGSVLNFGQFVLPVWS